MKNEERRMKNEKPPPDLPEGRRVKSEKASPQPLSKGREEWNEEGKGKNAI